MARAVLGIQRPSPDSTRQTLRKAYAVPKPPSPCVCTQPLSFRHPRELLDWSLYLITLAVILSRLPSTSADPRTNQPSVWGVLPYDYVNTSLAPFWLDDPTATSKAFVSFETYLDYLFPLCLKSKLLPLNDCRHKWSKEGKPFTDYQGLGLPQIHSFQDGTELFSSSKDQSYQDYLTWEFWSKLKVKLAIEVLPQHFGLTHKPQDLRNVCRDKCALKYCVSDLSDRVLDQIEYALDPPLLNRDEPYLVCGLTFKACYSVCASEPPFTLNMTVGRKYPVIPVDFGFDSELLKVTQNPPSDRTGKQQIVPPFPGMLSENGSALTPADKITPDLVDFNMDLFVRKNVEEAFTTFSLNSTVSNISKDLSGEERVLPPNSKDTPLHQLPHRSRRETSGPPEVPPSASVSPSLSNLTKEELDRSVLAFDCSQPLNIEPLQAPRKENDCSTRTTVETQKNVTFLVLQKAAHFPLKVIRCYLKSSIIPSGCGMFSHSWLVHPWIEIERPQRLRPGVCLEYWESQRYYDSRGSEHVIRRNALNTIKFMDVGDVDVRGNAYCTPGTIQRGDDSLTNVVQSRHLSLWMEEMDGFVDEDGNIRLQHQGRHFSCVASKGHCIIEWGTYIWDTPSFPERCLLYKTRETSGIVVSDGKASEVYMSRDDTLIRLVLEESTILCGYSVRRTGYDNLFVTEEFEAEVFQRPLPLSEYSILTHSTQQDGFLYGLLTRAIKKEHRDVILRDCQRRLNNQRTDFDGLIAQQNAPLEGRVAHLGGNYFITGAGDSYYRFRCRPITVIADPQDKCYSALPVKLHLEDARRYALQMGHNGTLPQLFVMPHSHLLSERGVAIPCSTSLPPLYRGAFKQWISIGKKTAQSVPAPVGLEMNSAKADLTLKDFNDIDWNDAGIYDPAESRRMEQLRGQGQALRSFEPFLNQRPGFDSPTPTDALEEYYRKFLEKRGLLHPGTYYQDWLREHWLIWGDWCSGVLGAIVAVRGAWLVIKTILKWFGFQLNLNFVQHPIVTAIQTLLRTFRDYTRVPPEDDPPPPPEHPPSNGTTADPTTPPSSNTTTSSSVPPTSSSSTPPPCSTLPSASPPNQLATSSTSVSPIRHRHSPYLSPSHVTQRQAKKLPPSDSTLTLQKLLQTTRDLEEENKEPITMSPRQFKRLMSTAPPSPSNSVRSYTSFRNDEMPPLQSANSSLLKRRTSMRPGNESPPSFKLQPGNRS